MVNAFYLGNSIEIGLVGIPYRLLVPFVAGVAMIFIVYLYLSKTFYGMAIQGVAQDSLAARLMGADPMKIKSVAFGMGMATASVAGALLILISPIEPSMGREDLGRVVAIALLGGLRRGVRATDEAVRRLGSKRCAVEIDDPRRKRGATLRGIHGPTCT